jgi:hypothetical protein
MRSRSARRRSKPGCTKTFAPPPLPAAPGPPPVAAEPPELDAPPDTDAAPPLVGAEPPELGAPPELDAAPPVAGKPPRFDAPPELGDSVEPPEPSWSGDRDSLLEQPASATRSGRQGSKNGNGLNRCTPQKRERVPLHRVTTLPKSRDAPRCPAGGGSESSQAILLPRKSRATRLTRVNRSQYHAYRRRGDLTRGPSSGCPARTFGVGVPSG